MKVLDLQCENQHVFEGWFGSEDDFASQQARGLIGCPLCGGTTVFKRLSAPRLNFGHAMEPASKQDVAPAAPRQDVVASPLASAGANPELAAAWLAVAKRVMANTEDVGDKFADEARKIHYGEAEERGIRGRASLNETRDLLEEGIAVSPLMLPEALKGSLQ